jgi:hypothetical protein
MAKKENIEIETVSKEIAIVCEPSSIVKVLLKDVEYEVSGDVANALIHTKRATLIS